MTPRHIPWPATCLLAAILLALPAARAQTVINGDFETPVFGAGGYQYALSPAAATWTFTSFTGISSSTGTWEPVGGATSQFAFIQLWYANQTESISQTIHLSGAGSYVLSYLEASRMGGDGVPYAVSLTKSDLSYVALNVSDSSGAGQPFTATAYAFTVPTAGDYILKFEAANGSEGVVGGALLLDNISVVPEPAAWAAIGGALALGAAGWKQRRGRAARR
jgi:hypothetical protein